MTSTKQNPIYPFKFVEDNIHIKQLLDYYLMDLGNLFDIQRYTLRRPLIILQFSSLY